MPRVPVDIPQVGQTAAQFPGFQAPVIQPAQNFAPQTIGSIGQGLSQLGESMGRTGAMVNREADQLAAEQERQQRVAEAEAKQKQADAERAQLRQDRFDDAVATDAKNQFSIYAKNQITAFGKLSGADAATQYPKFAEELEKKRKELSESLANDGQRKVFDSVTGLLITDYRNGMDKHAFDENERYQRQTFAASAELNASNYIDSYMNGVGNTSIDGKQTFGPYAGGYRIDPQAFKRAAESDLRRSMEGQPEEVIQVALRNGASKVHSGILQRMVEAGRTDLIEGYISSNRSEISDEHARSFGSIASRTEKSKGFITKAIAIATPIREKFKYYGSEQHSAVMRVLDKQLIDKQITEEEHAGIRSALVSLRENDEGIKTRFVGDVKMRAREAIKFLTSPDARQLSAASGFFGVPQLYAIRDEQDAEHVFAHNNPDLYQQVIEVGAREELLAMLKSEKPRDDEAALAEIENIERQNKDFYYNSGNIEGFASKYALRLTEETYNKYIRKFEDAQDASKAEDIRTRGNILSNTLIKEGLVNAAGEPIPDYAYGSAYNEFSDPAAKLAAFKHHVETAWENRQVAAKQKLSSLEYQKFLTEEFEVMKRTGINTPQSAATVEEAKKTFVTYTDPISNKSLSMSKVDIDSALVTQAQLALDEENRKYKVIATNKDGTTQEVASFENIFAAQEFKRKNASIGNLTVQNPSRLPEQNELKVLEKALQISLDSGRDANINIRTNRIKEWADSQDLKSRVSYIPDWVSGAARIAMPGYQAEAIKNIGMGSRAAMRSEITKLIEIAKEAESGKGNPYQYIRLADLTPLTGLDLESAKRLGAYIPMSAADEIAGDAVFSINRVQKFINKDTIRALEESLEAITKAPQ
jgi:hypothetical protein